MRRKSTIYYINLLFCEKSYAEIQSELHNRIIQLQN